MVLPLLWQSAGVMESTKSQTPSTTSQGFRCRAFAATKRLRPRRRVSGVRKEKQKKLKPETSFTGNATQLLTGRVVCPPCLVRTGVKINACAACGTGVSFVELVRKDLFLCTTVVTFADK